MSDIESLNESRRQERLYTKSDISPEEYFVMHMGFSNSERLHQKLNTAISLYSSDASNEANLIETQKAIGRVLELCFSDEGKELILSNSYGGQTQLSVWENVKRNGLREIGAILDMAAGENRYLFGPLLEVIARILKADFDA
jgi:hypothetical protein